MTSSRRRPGIVRDAVVHALEGEDAGLRVTEITRKVTRSLGAVPASSVRSSLLHNEGDLFERVAHGRYRLLRRP